MKSTRSHHMAASVIVAGLLLASAASATQYTVSDLGTLGGDVSQAWAINAAGQIVGQSNVGIGQESLHAFLYDGGTMTDLGTVAGDPHSSAFGINDNGNIVGPSFTLGELNNHAVRWIGGVPATLGDFLPRDINAAGMIVGVQNVDVSGVGVVGRAVSYNGTLVQLGTLGGDSSEALAVNNAGWIVGASAPAHDDPPHAFVAIAGTLHDLGTLGGDTSIARDINDNGQVVGVARNGAGQLHAFLYQLDAGGNVTSRTDLGELGGGYSTANAINNAGQVVGVSDARAFLWEQGAMMDLNTLLPPGSAWTLTRADGINDAGQIVGQGWINGQRHAFLLTPATACPGDLNHDGVVDIQDLSILLANYGTTSGAQPDDGDLDGDGDVDLADLAALLSVYDTSCP